MSSIWEWIAATLGLLSVVGNLRLKRWGWLVQAASSLIYIGIFYGQALPALAVLQVIFIVIAVWAWVQWGTKSHITAISVLAWPSFSGIVAGTLLAGIVFAYFLHPSLARIQLPQVLDGWLSAASLAAQWLMANRYRQTWILWFVVNAVSVVLFVSNGLYPTAMLYAIFSLLAVLGYRQWKK